MKAERGFTTFMKTQRGFTLIEVLVVVTLLSILATFSISNYSQIQKQGRDSRRKTDFSQVRAALELYYSVNNSYPVAAGIYGLPWSSVFSDAKGTYMKQLPTDPLGSKGTSYCYVPSGTPPTSYYLYAKLENTSDKDLLGFPEPGCGVPDYNYRVTD